MKLISISFLLVLFLACSNTPGPQDSPSEPLDEFLLLVQSTEGNQLTINCETGCAFQSLNFTLKPGQTRIVDQNGSKSTVDELRAPQTGLTMFTLSVTRRGDELLMEGHSGTAWTNLSFSAPVGTYQAINQLGVVSE